MSDKEEYRLFAERLQQLRIERNLTLEALAEELGIGATTIWQYENCHREPRWKSILKMMRYFNVTSDWLMGITNERDR